MALKYSPNSAVQCNAVQYSTCVGKQPVSFAQQQATPQGHSCPLRWRQVHDAYVAAPGAVEVLQPDLEGLGAVQELGLQLDRPDPTQHSHHHQLLIIQTQIVGFHLK